jgi:hypothetical protein
MTPAVAAYRPSRRQTAQVTQSYAPPQFNAEFDEDHVAHDQRPDELSNDRFDASSGMSSNGPGAQSGSIHLDGNVLGEWVTRHLERVLNRPALGPSSVDPRVVPGWGIMSGY